MFGHITKTEAGQGALLYFLQATCCLNGVDRGMIYAIAKCDRCLTDKPGQ